MFFLFELHSKTEKGPFKFRDIIMYFTTQAGISMFALRHIMQDSLMA